jgi:ubiquinone/menaquinone biosynthesis C-methylase UbiE
VAGVTLLDELRSAELASVRRNLPPVPARVLELGAGTGWQSSLLRKAGYEVAAVDVDVEPAAASANATVLPIDGVRMPFASSCFDAVFSSNVLEHVVDLPGLLAEVDRVLRPGGRSVHVMPTPTWRVATMVTFYLTVPKRAMQWAAASRTKRAGSVVPAAGDTSAAGVGRRQRLVRAIFHEPPHGEFRSAIAEIPAYRVRAWRARLGGRARFVEPAGIFYSGYALVPRLPMRWRRGFARLLGSSCRVYVCERARTETAPVR